MNVGLRLKKLLLASAALLSLSCIVLVWVWGDALLRNFGFSRPQAWVIESLLTLMFLIAASLPLIFLFQEPRLPKISVSPFQKRVEAAVAFLKKTRLKTDSKKHLIDLPHYLILGPRDAGKTTLLSHSGLKFLLSKKQGKNNQDAAAPTRHCDWWVTTDAVYLDLGHEHAIHNHLGEEPKRKWLSFLEEIKKSRGHRGVNGVIVVMSLPELESYARSKRARHEDNIHQRLEEIDLMFQTSVPVYIFLNKCDKVAGFPEFFNTMTQIEREQIFGFTLDPNKERTQFSAECGEEFRRLVQRLSERTSARLHQEYNIERRGLILNFAWTFNGYKKSIERFIQNIFDKNATEKQLNLRGIYFTAAIESPENPVLTQAKNTALQSHEDIPYKTRIKSYFIKHVFKKVIQHEATLVYATRRERPQHSFGTSISYALCGFLLLGAVFYWGDHMIKNSKQMDVVTDHVGRYLTTMQTNNQDLADIARGLNELELANTAFNNVHAPWFVRYLKPDQNFSALSQTIIQQTLQNQFLPAIGAELATQANTVGTQQNPTVLQGAVTAYMMLTNPINLKPDFVVQWMTIYWKKLYAGKTALQAMLKEDLEKALAGMGEHGIPALADMNALAENVLAGPTNVAENTAVSAVSTTNTVAQNTTVSGDTPEAPAMSATSALPSTNTVQIAMSTPVATTPPETTVTQPAAPAVVVAAQAAPQVVTEGATLPASSPSDIGLTSNAPASTGLVAATPAYTPPVKSAKNLRLPSTMQTQYGTITVEPH